MLLSALAAALLLVGALLTASSLVRSSDRAAVLRDLVGRRALHRALLLVPLLVFLAAQSEYLLHPPLIAY